MLYKPLASWGDAHKVRLTWAVQMLVDVCQQSTGANCDSYVNGGTDGHNQVQIVHTYYDDFTLTGFNVRENRGTEYGIVYEDPSVDTALNVDDTLVRAESGLDAAFPEPARLRHDQHGQRVRGQQQARHYHRRSRRGRAKLEDRLDRTRNGGATLEQRWGLPGVLRVATRSYAASRPGHDPGRLGRRQGDPGLGLYAALERVWAGHAHAAVLLRGLVPRPERLAREPGQRGHEAEVGPKQQAVDLGKTMMQAFTGLNWAP